MSNFNNDYRFRQLYGSDNSQLLTSRQTLVIPGDVVISSPSLWDLDSFSTRSQCTTVFFQFTGADQHLQIEDSLITSQFAGDALTFVIEGSGDSGCTVDFGNSFFTSTAPFTVGIVHTFQFISCGFTWAMVSHTNCTL